MTSESRESILEPCEKSLKFIPASLLPDSSSFIHNSSLQIRSVTPAEDVHFSSSLGGRSRCEGSRISELNLWVSFCLGVPMGSDHSSTLFGLRSSVDA